MTQNIVDYSQNPDGQELLDNYISKSQENALTLHSGIQRPPYAKEGTMWLDTSSTPWMLKVYDGTDDIIIGSLDAGMNRFIPSDPLTTTGDLIVEGEDGKPTRLASGAKGTVLTSNGAGQIPSFLDILPVGVFMPYAADTPPEGWLVCDGSAVGREDYSELFALIGTKYGAGDNSTTFNLPNFINRTFWGGTSSGTYLEAGLPNITGTVRPADVARKSYPTAMNSPNGAFHALQETTTGLYSINSGESKYLNGLGIDASRSNAIYGKSSTVQPPALQTLIIIKY